MRVPSLPFVAELGHGLRLSLRDEDRIEAEARRPARLARDPPVERAGPAQLPAVRSKCDELADVARVAAVAFDPFELAEHPAHLVAGGPARRAHAGTAVEARDFDARVLAKHPDIGRCVRAAERRLRARVVVVRLAGLGRVVGGGDTPHLPTRQGPLVFSRLVRVPGGEERLQSARRTSATCSTAPIRATRWGAATPRGNTRSSSSGRRSPCWLTT